MNTCGTCAWWLCAKYTHADRDSDLTVTWGNCRNEQARAFSVDHDAPACPLWTGNGQLNGVRRAAPRGKFASKTLATR